MRDLTFYLANTPPLPGPCLDVDIDRFSRDTIKFVLVSMVSEAGSTPICLCFSCPPET